MFCRTCRNYPRHIEEFEGLREISLSVALLSGGSKDFTFQPCEVEVIADKMKDCLQIENRHPAILLRIGYAHPVAYSPRKQASSIIFNK